MKSEVFIDTSGFYALLAKRDDCHLQAAGYLRKAAATRTRFVTTDYVLDETATLLKARGQSSLLVPFFERVFASNSCRVTWTDAERFHQARQYFLKHSDQSWSFTDCLSFCVMKECHAREALTKDAHFNAAGFVALLAPPTA
jgi:predicted nucleic acid-binding protein